MRKIRLPSDLTAFADVAGRTWHYPENQEWSLQPDELEAMVDSMHNLRRLWPLVRVLQTFSPPLRDIMQGYVWEEAGQAVGFVQAQRRGTTGQWFIGAVGVVPEYRRQGIARQLVVASLDLIRQRGGRMVVLDVISGNLPAVRLYESLGFQTFSGNIDMEIDLRNPPPAPSMPPGHRQESASLFDWRPRFELNQRVTPQELQAFEPVTEGRFRQPALTRLLWPLIRRAQGLIIGFDYLYGEPSGQIVAISRWEGSSRGTGRNLIRLFLDPAHAALAPYLVGNALHQVTTTSPGLVTEFSGQVWQLALIDAAQDAGFRERVRHLRMGRIL
jgi:ribosomal protein S18 acetylase RimI-like enzyme